MRIVKVAVVNAKRFGLLAAVTALFAMAPACASAPDSSGSVDDEANAPNVSHLPSGHPSVSLARPASVPINYVATPNGYFDPSCIQEVGDTETIGENHVIARADGSTRVTPPCTHERYDREGHIIATSHGVDAQTADSTTGGNSQPTVQGWTEEAQALTESVGTMVAKWTVPAAPGTNAGQTVYYFPGLEDPAGSIILQPVLGWNQQGVKGWSIASWNCCHLDPGQDATTKATIDHSPVIAVNPGDTIAGFMAGEKCDANGVCAKWTVTTIDSTINKISQLTTTAYGLPMNWVYGGVLESYDIDNCSELPTNGSLTFSNLLVENTKGVAITPSYNNIVKSVSPQCGYKITTGANSVRLINDPTTMKHYDQPTKCGVIASGQGFSVYEDVSSCNYEHYLSLELSGDLEYFGGTDGNPTWTSRTALALGYSAVMQTDGNFVLYDLMGRAIWSTGTQGHPGAHVALKDDGTFGVYATNGAVLWSHK